MITLLTIITSFAIIFFGIIKLGQYDNPRLFGFFIKRYSKQDKINFPEPGSIVFTGSSVIKFWKTIEKDLFPFYVLNRGLAGAKINEIVYWVDELVIKYKPKAVVLYAGSNDIQGNKPRTSTQVLQGFIEFSNKIHKSIPGLPVIFLPIIPSPAKTRWKNWSEIQKANSLIKEYCETNDFLIYIDNTIEFVDSNGIPKESLFKKDKIHLNDNGYKVWSHSLRPFLKKL